ncbi:MAG: DUF721 domain-containing protein [Azoarcus sp.]|jgi:hypothetical protein|nr:DUF721 domain-containing protein [Azoarcus sp.]
MSTLLHRYVGRDSPLARLQDHAARLGRLQTVLADALPTQFAHACRVANLKDDVLTLTAHGSAIAVRLKQMIPSLQEHFARAGHPVQRIKIKVGLPDGGQKRPASPLRALSPTARASIEALAAALPVDAPLRKSLETLARRGRA